MAAINQVTPGVRLVVELVRDTEAASGWIESGSGERREFASLLELISLLEGARLPIAAKAEEMRGKHEHGKHLA